MQGLVWDSVSNEGTGDVCKCFYKVDTIFSFVFNIIRYISNVLSIGCELSLVLCGEVAYK